MHFLPLTILRWHVNPLQQLICMTNHVFLHRFVIQQLSTFTAKLMRLLCSCGWGKLFSKSVHFNNPLRTVSLNRLIIKSSARFMPRNNSHLSSFRRSDLRIVSEAIQSKSLNNLIMVSKSRLNLISFILICTLYKDWRSPFLSEQQFFVRVRGE